MQIRKMQIQDLAAVTAIYARARAFMAETGNPKQWGATNWPPEWLIKEDIALGRGHVCVDEKDNVLGAFCYMYGENAEPGYLNLEDGVWAKEGVYGVVHRVATDGTKGVGSFCLNWAYEKSGYLRIDTHPDNRVMQNLLNKFGFVRRGIVHVEEDNDPRFAYDKI